MTCRCIHRSRGLRPRFVVDTARHAARCGRISLGFMPRSGGRGRDPCRLLPGRPSTQSRRSPRPDRWCPTWIVRATTHHGPVPPRVMGGSECERRESNPHAFRHWNLNPARLPISPLSRGAVGGDGQPEYGICQPDTTRTSPAAGRSFLENRGRAKLQLSWTRRTERAQRPSRRSVASPPR
jgi:hypothetical protein